jgi:hypothetical protein
MKTFFSTLVIAVLAVGVLLVVSPGKADAWYGGPAVGFSVVVPPFGISIGAPAPYYYSAPVYVAPSYPVYGRRYYSPYYGQYYGYRPYPRYYHGDHGDRWRGDWHDRGYGRGRGHWRH